MKTVKSTFRLSENGVLIKFGEKEDEVLTAEEAEERVKERTRGHGS